MLTKLSHGNITKKRSATFRKITRVLKPIENTGILSPFERHSLRSRTRNHSSSQITYEEEETHAVSLHLSGNIPTNSQSISDASFKKNHRKGKSSVSNEDFEKLFAALNTS